MDRHEVPLTPNSSASGTSPGSTATARPPTDWRRLIGFSAAAGVGLGIAVGLILAFR